MKRRCLYRRIRNLIQPRRSLGLLFIVMLDVFSILRKTTESLSFWDFFFFFGKVAQTVPGRHGKWWRCGWAWLACSSTELHPASLRLKQLSEDVMRNASVAVRDRSSPPPHNKTWEKPMTMEWSRWRTFASHWPSACQTGPPVRHALLPWVTPCITSISNSCEWKWSLPHIETHNPSPMALESEKRWFLLSEPKQPPSSSQLRTKTN